MKKNDFFIAYKYIHKYKYVLLILAMHATIEKITAKQQKNKNTGMLLEI